jgi:protein-S-isoprenylcysteine O-methyltransferase Ste14
VRGRADCPAPLRQLLRFTASYASRLNSTANGWAKPISRLWLLALLVPFYLVIRYGVVAREEAYLERKFGGVYLAYKSRVRRWL